MKQPIKSPRPSSLRFGPTKSGNTAKFKTINAAETHLPLKVFSDEWQNLKRDRPENWLPSNWRKWLKWYVEFTIVEMTVPLVFAVLYLAILFI